MRPNFLTDVSSMIHSARLTVSPAVNIVFAWNLFCFARFWKVETNVRTDNLCENNDHYRQWLWVGLVDQKRWSFCLLSHFGTEQRNAFIYKKIKNNFTVVFYKNQISVVSYNVNFQRAEMLSASLKFNFMQVNASTTANRECPQEVLLHVTYWPTRPRPA